MARIPRKDQRRYEVSVNDGRGTATVWIVDGYDRPITDDMRDRTAWVSVVGVHTRAEAIEAALAEGIERL
jgi:hypothetical protein